MLLRSTALRCPICGAAHCTCGPAHTTGSGVRVHDAIKEDPMALEEYEVIVNGMPTVMQLSPGHAARLGGKRVGERKSAATEPAGQQPAGDKARRPRDK